VSVLRAAGDIEKIEFHGFAVRRHFAHHARPISNYARGGVGGPARRVEVAAIQSAAISVIVNYNTISIASSIYVFLYPLVFS
jgi:hypothetical protein